MFTIVKALDNDFSKIREIAFATWPTTYADILSAEQISYMLEKFYDVKSLQENAKNNQEFYVLKEGNHVVGFISVEHHYKNEKVTRLHKIYVLPSIQGKNAGRFLIDFIEDIAIKIGSKRISLNVNRFNKAVTFYKKMNFEIVMEEEVALDFGYIMDDYRMEKTLKTV